MSARAVVETEFVELTPEQEAVAVNELTDQYLAFAETQEALGMSRAEALDMALRDLDARTVRGAEPGAAAAGRGRAGYMSFEQPSARRGVRHEETVRLAGEHGADMRVVTGGVDMAVRMLEGGWSELMRVNERVGTFEQYLKSLNLKRVPKGYETVTNADGRVVRRQRYELVADFQSDLAKEAKRWGIKTATGTAGAILSGAALGFFTGGFSTAIVAGAAIGGAMGRMIPKLWKLTFGRKEDVEFRMAAANAELARVEALEEFAWNVMDLNERFLRQRTPENYSLLLEAIQRLVDAKNKSTAPGSAEAQKAIQDRERDENRLEEMLGFVGTVAGGGLGAMSEKIINGSVDATAQAKLQAMMDPTAGASSVEINLDTNPLKHAADYINGQFYSMIKPEDVAAATVNGKVVGLTQFGGAAVTGPGVAHAGALPMAATKAALLEAFAAETRGEIVKNIFLKAPVVIAGTLLGSRLGRKAVDAEVGRQFNVGEAAHAARVLNPNDFEKLLKRERSRVHAALNPNSLSGVSAETGAASGSEKVEISGNADWKPDDLYDLSPISFYDTDDEEHAGFVRIRSVHGKPGQPGFRVVVDGYKNQNDPNPMATFNGEELTFEQLRNILSVNGENAKRIYRKGEPTGDDAKYLTSEEGKGYLKQIAEAGEGKMEVVFTKNAKKDALEKVQTLLDPTTKYRVLRVDQNREDPQIVLQYEDSDGKKSELSANFREFSAFIEKLEPLKEDKKEEEKKETIEEQVDKKIKERIASDPVAMTNNRPPNNRITARQAYKLPDGAFYLVATDEKNDVTLQKIETDGTNQDMPAKTNQGKFIKVKENPITKSKLELADEYTIYGGIGTV